MFSLRKKKPLYLELEDKKFFIARLKKTKNNLLKLVSNHSKSINLQNNEIINGTVYNPTEIRRHIQNFFKKNQLKKPSILLSLPDLSKDRNLIPHQIFQIVLFLSKTGATISKIVTSSLFKKNKTKSLKEINKMHDHLQLLKAPTSSSPFLWLTMLIVILALISPFLTFQQHNKEQELALLLNKKTKVDLCKNKIQEKINFLSFAKQKQSKLSAALNQISKTTNSNFLSQALTSIAQKIPCNTLLTKLKLYKTHSNKKNRILEIQGKTPNNEELSLFLEKLHHSSPLKNIQLTLFEEIKETISPLFKFVISVNLDNNLTKIQNLKTNNLKITQKR